MAAVGGAGGSVASGTTVTQNDQGCQALHSDFAKLLESCITVSLDETYKDGLKTLQVCHESIKKDRKTVAVDYVSAPVKRFNKKLNDMLGVYDADEVKRKPLTEIQKMFANLVEQCYNMKPDGSVYSDNSRGITPASPYSMASPGRSRKRSRKSRRKSRRNSNRANSRAYRKSRKTRK
jgi:hypothetical protein